MLIQIQKVTKTYHLSGKKVHHALSDLSLDLEEGEVFGLLGVNGAGKTTLSSIIASLVPATSGDILWRGNSIYKQLIDYRKILGFCPQHQNLDSALTLEKNLHYAGRYYNLGEKRIKARKKELMEKFDLMTYANEKAHILSGGYRQRFLIARTLMHFPKLVILDEPTVGLDPHVRRDLWKLILDLKKEGVTVLLTTHYLDEAEALCDRVCIIDHGQMKTLDTPKNLMNSWKHTSLEDVFLSLIDQKEMPNE